MCLNGERTFWGMAKGVSISTCRDEQCRQGWNNQDSKEIQRVVETLKKTRVEQIILSGILPVMRGRVTTFRNCKRMAINALLEQMCEEEGVGFVDILLGKKTCI